tara:strand:+ start:25817 stop:26443 length:627 start_codon:yes stop_codon:yes gene_type:complete
VWTQAEHARTALAILDGIMGNNNMPKSHFLHLSIRDGFQDARRNTRKRISIAVLFCSPLAQVVVRAVGIAHDFIGGHEHDLVLLSLDEPMVLVVAVMPLAQEARSGPIVRAESGGSKPPKLLLARKVKPCDLKDKVTVLVAHERERVLALCKQRKFVERKTSMLNLVAQVSKKTSQAFARQGSDVTHQSSPVLPVGSPTTGVCHSRKP